MTGDSPLVVMGPSGAGKTTIGTLLAERLGLAFVDGDSLHPARNLDKMAAGQPLDDDDRAPWLDAIGRALATGPVVVACSALKRRYRDHIRSLAPATVFLELRSSREELERRMSSRKHFMPASLLHSQLSTLQPLEPDEPGTAVANDATVDVVTSRCVATLASLPTPDQHVGPG
ncbi:gluconokinase [Amycolatopsis aidingensis]|uniref:gluconokinase n=1 Tax=Amycolatopsis aidingensis TaxID=2842453 RepID=UPI001C0D8316|nr:gluconokinase [Amycolatopsis aidingensis]